MIEITLMKLQQTYDYLQDTKDHVTPRKVIDALRGDDVKKRKEGHGILAIFNKETERMKTTGVIVGSTLRRRECVRRGFEDFIQKAYRRDDYPVEKVNAEFIRSYETYLMSEHRQSNNTLARYIKFLKTIILYAHANGYISKNPFYGIKYHLEPVDHPFLTVNELQALLSKKFDIDRLSHSVSAVSPGSRTPTFRALNVMISSRTWESSGSTSNESNPARYTRSRCAMSPKP